MLDKKNIYYFVHSKIQDNYQVELKVKNISDSLYGLKLDDINLKYKNLSSANINEMDIKTYFFVNTIKIENIKINSILKNFLPQHVKYIKLKHTLLQPTIIEIESNFNLGSANGFIDLSSRVVKLNLKIDKRFLPKYRLISNEIKKYGKGEYYTYEYRF
jgi:hypothetical protein